MSPGGNEVEWYTDEKGKRHWRYVFRVMELHSLCSEHAASLFISAKRRKGVKPNPNPEGSREHE